jgi:succinate dehydrogenase/fumarate reductase flavoprotein subunit
MIEDAPVGKRSGAALPGGPAPLPGNSSIAQKEPPKAASKPSPACATLTKIRDVMWREVGILRSGKELTDAIKQLQALELAKSQKPGRAEHELRNLHALALLIARSGLAREESRGSHYRSDFPYRNDEDFGKHSTVQKGKDVRFEV